MPIKKRGVGDFDRKSAKNRENLMVKFLKEIEGYHFECQKTRLLFAEWLVCRFVQYSESLTAETIKASIAFINDEPNPDEVIERAINRPQKCYCQFFPTDPNVRAKYKRLKTYQRYAVRTKRALRSDKTAITDTVFIPRKTLEMYDC